MTETRLKIIETIKDYMDKTLGEGCIVAYEVKTKGCGDKTHGPTYDCKYMPSSCWVEKTKYIQYRLGCQTNFTKHKIALKKQVNCGYDVSTKGMVFDVLDGDFNGIFFELEEDFIKYQNKLQLLSGGKMLSLLYSKGFKIDKIIGHYDITAVLRYIMDNKYYALNNPNSFYIRGKGIVDGKEYSDVYCGLIPNKPLHLFTEKEDEKLLLLLNKMQGIK